MRFHSISHALAAAALIGTLALLPAFSHAGEATTPPESTGGTLDLDGLIRLALQSSPEVVRLRSRIATTFAEEKAASDWRDPELRIGYSRQHDVELPQSETETRRTRSSETTQQNRSEFERDNISGDLTQSERRGTTTTRTEEFETRRTTPGARSDRITTETREITTETTSFSDRSTQNNPFTGSRSTGSEDVTQSTSERTTGRSVEDRSFGFDRTDPDSDIDFSLRLRPPNPWEIKAKKHKARTRREKFRSLIHAAEFEVISDVRKAYADAQEAAAELHAARKLSAVRTKILNELKANSTQSQVNQINNLGGSTSDLYKLEKKLFDLENKRLSDIIDAEGELISADWKVADLELELSDSLSALAIASSLGDPSRISLASNLMPTGIDIGALDPNFLYSIAEGWREDILELVHDAKITTAELQEYNSQKIPWITLLEGFYEVDNERGRRSSDAYGFQIGISIPIFSWLTNNEDDVYRSEIESLELQAAALRRQIRAEIDTSLRHLAHTRARIAQKEALHKKRRDQLNKHIANSKNNNTGDHKSRFRNEELLVELNEQLADIREHEINALLRLERALGAEFREVLGRTANAKKPSPPLP